VPEPPAFPRSGWIFIVASALLGVVAALAARHASDGDAINPAAIVTAASCVGVGALLAWLAYRKARGVGARLPMLLAAVLLGFCATAVGMAFIAVMMGVLSPRA